LAQHCATASTVQQAGLGLVSSFMRPPPGIVDLSRAAVGASWRVIRFVLLAESSAVPPAPTTAMTTPRTDERFAASVTRAAGVRYAALAGTDACLSCGGAVDLAAPLPGETLVDLGSGRGGDLVRASERVGAEGQAIGVDASEAMLEVARERTAELANVRLVKSDLAAIDLPDGCADVVISNCTINHAPDKVAVYREVHRLLRPGGRVVVSDVVAEEELPASVRADPAAWAACYGGAIPEADYLAAIATAGLAGVRVLRRSEPYEKGGVRVRSLTVEARR